ncbi:hypothetical protein VBQ23_21595, partial [Klebsiella pneumoniae]|nr:hypothetical protein [Klebsiella pneumoniae]
TTIYCAKEKFYPLPTIKHSSPIEYRFEISSGADIQKISVIGDKMNVTSPKILEQGATDVRK